MDIANPSYRSDKPCGPQPHVIGYLMQKGVEGRLVDIKKRNK